MVRIATIVRKIYIYQLQIVDRNTDNLIIQKQHRWRDVSLPISEITMKFQTSFGDTFRIIDIQRRIGATTTINTRIFTLNIDIPHSLMI